MNFMKRFLGAMLLAATLTAVVPDRADAQCAMCTLTAENATQNGNNQGKGLNKGILFLLAIPYLAAVGVGVLWYKKYRSKKTVTMDDEPIVLN
ncbi:hypothetical protein [Parapedobacter sp.]|uniref:hypothetical protein n=1 Tax=Parapedobacter sp. TaxID=1958893 RepID=UPI002D80CFBF|nr:hypothetical protein [Parapedobacter sp.]